MGRSTTRRSTTNSSGTTSWTFLRMAAITTRIRNWSLRMTKERLVIEKPSRRTTKNRPVLYLAKIPPDPGGQLAAILAMFRKLTGREPTPEEIEDARKELEQ